MNSQGLHPVSAPFSIYAVLVETVGRAVSTSPGEILEWLKLPHPGKKSCVERTGAGRWIAKSAGLKRMATSSWQSKNMRKSGAIKAEESRQRWLLTA